MKNVTTSGKALLAAALVTAGTGLAPATATAAAFVPLAHYREPAQGAVAAPARSRPLPPVSRGTKGVLPEDRERAAFSRRLARG